MQLYLPIVGFYHHMNQLYSDSVLCIEPKVKIDILRVAS